jgi:hypothetical protein
MVLEYITIIYTLFLFLTPDYYFAFYFIFYIEKVHISFNISGMLTVEGLVKGCWFISLV